MASSVSDAFLFKILIGLSAIIICTAYVPTTLPPNRNVNFIAAAKKLPPRGPGICMLEVPTVDLLSEADRRGPIPPGNGVIIHICCSGWKPKPHVANKCEPVCDNGCVNGNCNNCIPTCPKGCLHGVCTLQGTCSCSAGFTLDLKGQFCIPICLGGCGMGGNCTAPNVCSCKPGFKKNVATSKCEYNCEGGCPSGTHCIGPNECSCPSGFIKRNNACEAQCPRGCLNGLYLTGTSCQAHCSQPCLNGECTGPNVCVAYCPNGCLNGQCASPNLCICNPVSLRIKRRMLALGEYGENYIWNLFQNNRIESNLKYF
ncbi:hypothetical protein RI129_000910 [Pyrocoelia pectoralis]|uniref:EGF-like domain-containing protein n=1 Tax=Pyrocoelia pectoralis TaxID=417401 RepID=A0AAN7ZWL9_9COLE